ncbi:MAG: glutamyl-tRNA amidotransferase [Bacteroidetes bacterium SW_11_45_7]|nr:MAG: glutamyl-tRNA amidotransferase [Bacteroidetes bacterium SW_11_45_7]
MTLTERINEDLKKAMREKDQVAMRALRSIKTAILNAEREKGAGGEVTDDQVIQILNKEIKQRKESIEYYENQERDDQAQSEKDEVAVIEHYLPASLSEEELSKEIDAIIEDTGASGMKDMGSVMGVATKKLAGKADNKAISDMVKQKLGG